MDPAERLMQEAMRFVKPIDEATERGDSDVQQFYQNAVLFLTGATGFIGKQLLEKLFRSCDIKKAYVLIRSKKGKSTEDRLQDILGDSVFELVLKKKPDLASRIVCVEGDVGSIQLGISNDDWNTLVQEVDIIFHVAATVRFDENLRTAALINVQGTREALALGRGCQKLRQSLGHLSTAYSHATFDRTAAEVWEQFYPSPVPARTLLELVDTVDETRLNTLTQSLISGWPNTYTFTKAIAEGLIQAESGNLPVCIVRPSIVLHSYHEPAPGWLDVGCVFGPTGMIVGGALGVIRVILANDTFRQSFVPVDYVNNATIAAGWNTGLRGLQEPLIYNIGTTDCGLTFDQFITIMMSKGRTLPTPLALWYYFTLHTNNRFVFLLLSWLLHYIPAYIIDTAMCIFQIKKPRGFKSFTSIYKKYDKLSSVFSCFLTHGWHFEDGNLQDLWQKMSNTDKTIYNYDKKSIDWDHYILLWCLGTRKYILRDGLKGTEVAVTRQKWLKLANYLVAIVYLAVICLILSWLWWFVRIMF